MLLRKAVINILVTYLFLPVIWKVENLSTTGGISLVTPYGVAYFTCCARASTPSDGNVNFRLRFFIVKLINNDNDN